jgi:hypothetical protein
MFIVGDSGDSKTCILNQPHNFLGIVTYSTFDDPVDIDRCRPLCQKKVEFLITHWSEHF